MSTDTQKAGANARASGASFLDNPFYQPKSMPAATGQNIRDWEVNALAWEIGWRVEDAIREDRWREAVRGTLTTPRESDDAPVRASR
jgi:hypothetical protein